MNRSNFWSSSALFIGILFMREPFLSRSGGLISQQIPVTTTPQTSDVRNPNAPKSASHYSAPKVIHFEEPEIPKIARKANVGGTVLVSCYVETDGIPSDVHAVQTDVDQSKKATDPRIAQALTESAVDTVKRYRFKPATKDGASVRVQLKVQVDFRP
jgi:TonB family protein